MKTAKIIVFALLLIAIAVAPIFAQEGMVDTSQYAKEAPYTLCFSNASLSNSWRVSMVEHVRYQVEQYADIGTYLETDANDDATKQIADIEDLLTQGCDVLIVSPATADALTPVVESAMEMGVPVVTLDRNIASDSYVSFVEQSSCDMGAAMAQWLADTLGGEGNVVMMSGIAGATPAEDRLRCAREVFANYPGITEIAQAYTNWSPVEGKQVMENWITQFGDTINGVWSDSGLQGSGGVEAFVEAGMSVPPITGEDFNRYLVQWNELGFEGIAVSYTVRQGATAVDTAVAILRGEPVPHHVLVDPTVITNDNLAEFVRPDLPDDYWAASLPEVAARLFPDAVQPTPEPTEEMAMVDTTQYVTDAPWTVCFSNASLSNSWRVSMVEHVRYQVEQYADIGTYLETDANDDATKQIADIEDLLTQGCDVLIVSPATADALTPVVESAMEMGVPVVTLDRNIASDSYVSFVEQSSCDMGAAMAQWLADTLGGEGNVVMMSGIAGATPAEDRLRCAREVFANYPGITEIAQAYTNWSPVEGKQVMENWITQFGDTINGVWSDSGLQGSGGVEAFVEAGMSVPPITGEDFNRYLVQWNELGFEGIAVSYTVRQGATAVDTAVAILRGEPVPHHVLVDPTVITNDNLAEFVRPDLPDDYWAASLPEVAARLFPN